ncbi:putative Zinc finger protein ZPR1 [Paratrimastix pyriformis]|uniref:Zinc finger protein ZPR1 n=1 Tax=Paratrimastix pyriformis TaxID=342808 RepID=A0ABQ8UQF1_9EUKA|nr:putative Zinc finger protein ZPR1 [Paratrimastix pyriformis]
MSSPPTTVPATAAAAAAATPSTSAHAEYSGVIGRKDHKAIVPKGLHFDPLSSDSGPQQIESLCMSCGEQGMTNLLLTSIPFFRDVILMAFECPHCGYRSSELQAAQYAEVGCHFEVVVRTPQDLNRTVVRTEHATVSIPELQFEAPPSPDRAGELTTVEGVIRSSIEKLEELQPLRRIQVPEQAAQLDAFLERMRGLLELGSPFTFALDDPTGNSFIENLRLIRKRHGTAHTVMPIGSFRPPPRLLPTASFSSSVGRMSCADRRAPQPDPQLTSRTYERSHEQCVMLGLNVGQELAHSIVGKSGTVPDSFESTCMRVAKPEDIVEMPMECFMCHRDGVVRMVVANIPMFKEIVLMCFSCPQCGYRSTEIKPGGRTNPTGRRITVRCTSGEDLSRDLLKSDTATIRVVELDMDVEAGSLGGMFTTIEGLLVRIRERIECGSCHMGDSTRGENRARFAEFRDRLTRMIDGQEHFTLILDDPISNSYVQDLCAPDPDPNLTLEEYTRTREQDEELGLLDMKTEGYEERHEEHHEHHEEAEPTPATAAAAAAPAETCGR